MESASRYESMTIAQLVGALADAVDSENIPDIVVVAVEIGRHTERALNAATPPALPKE